MRRRAAPEPARNLLDLVPKQVAAGEEVDERIVLLRPRPPGRGIRPTLQRLSQQLAVQRIRLDATGSATWRLIDGSRTVGEIAAALRESHDEEIDAAEDRVARFVRILRREGFVELDDPPDPIG